MDMFFYFYFAMLYTMARKLTSTLFNKAKHHQQTCLTITKMELWESKWKVYQANTCYKIWILLISNHFDVRHAKEAPESSFDPIYNQFSGNDWRSCECKTCALPKIQDYGSTFVDWTKIGSFWIELRHISLLGRVLCDSMVTLSLYT